MSRESWEFEQDLLAVITALTDHWEPHPGQQDIIRAILIEEITSIFISCGRKWGKTELALLVLWAMARIYPNSPCYYIAPLQTQAREILWADPRVQFFGPRDWLLPSSQGINRAEMRINFKNGSFIKIDGSDNFNKYRGVRYRVCIYDEYKDHRPEFRKAMRPNASVLGGIDLYLGTPPDRDCDYISLMKAHQIDPGSMFKQAKTEDNPHIDKEWLAKERALLFARGEQDVWYREYEAQVIFGSEAKIFPMLDKGIVKPHAEVLESIKRDAKKLQWIWFADPAAATCFGVIFLAINPYTKHIYALDEIYETKQAEMSVKQIGSRIIQKREALFNRRDWDVEGYDEAETWFTAEYMRAFESEPGLMPSHKHLNAKDDGISLIKDILLSNRLTISDACPKFYWELDNYYKDKKGKIPKKNDHLIDPFRYALGSISYEIKDVLEIIKEQDPDWRGSTMEQDMPEMFDRFDNEM